MGLTGKYKFEGIQEAGLTTLQVALAGSPLLKFPFFKTLSKLLINLLANQGLVIANVGVYMVNGKIDAHKLRTAIDGGIDEVDSGKTLSPADIKRIDDEVRNAARKAFPYGRKPTKP